MIKSKLCLLTHYCWFARFEKKNFFPLFFKCCCCCFFSIVACFFISVAVGVVGVVAVVMSDMKASKSYNVFYLQGYVDIQQWSETALQDALATVDPITVSIDAGQPSFLPQPTAESTMTRKW